jgi:hypothetical protein
MLLLPIFPYTPIHITLIETFPLSIMIFSMLTLSIYTLTYYGI